MIYFDQSATSLHKPPQVAQAMARALGGEYANPVRGVHAPALNALQQVARARRTLGAYFDVTPLDVAFTFNATVALNMVIKGVLSPNDRVLTTPYAHNAMLRPLYQLQDAGMQLDILPQAGDAPCTSSDFARHIQPGTTAIALNPMSNVTGDVAPLQEIIAFCYQRGLLLILDLSQWAGMHSLPQAAHWPPTLMAFTGHKSLYGPPGTGGVIRRGGVALRPVITGGSGVHSFERRHPSVFPDVLEAGTPNLPGIMGLEAGVAWLAATGQEAISRRLQMLRRRFVAGLAGIPGLRVYGGGEAAGAVVALNIGAIPSGDISAALDARWGIATRAGSHCAPLMHQALGTEKQGAVRFSFSYFNQEEEIDLALAALATLAAQR